jgi:hypothetical protein
MGFLALAEIILKPLQGAVPQVLLLKEVLRRLLKKSMIMFPM